MFLRPGVGNDSSQYGRVEGAVSGCRPAGPQNVGQRVSACLVCIVIIVLTIRNAPKVAHGIHSTSPSKYCFTFLIMHSAQLSLFSLSHMWSVKVVFDMRNEKRK